MPFFGLVLWMDPFHVARMELAGHYQSLAENNDQIQDMIYCEITLVMGGFKLFYFGWWQLVQFSIQYLAAKSDILSFSDWFSLTTAHTDVAFVAGLMRC